MIIGGVKSSMYRDLPSPLVAEFGFQVNSFTHSFYSFINSVLKDLNNFNVFYFIKGCLASLEIHGTVVDPNKVREACKNVLADFVR